MLKGARLIRKTLSDDKRFFDVIVKSMQSVGVRLAGLAANFIISILLAKHLGAEGLGAYALVTTILLLGSVFGRVGLDNVMMREVARCLSVDNNGSIIGVLKKSTAVCLVSSALVSVFLYYAAPYIGDILDSEGIEDGVRYMAIFIIPFSLLVLIVNVIKGYEKTWQATLLENAGFNILRLIGIGVLVFFGVGLSLEGVYVVHVAAILLCFCIGIFFMSKLVDWRPEENTCSYTMLLSSSVPLLWVASIDLANAHMDTIMLGVLSSTSEVGYYDVAYRVSMLIGFVLVSFNSILGPKFAALYKKGELAELESLACKGTVVSLLFSLPLIFLFIVFPGFVLSVWGEEFVRGQNALIALSIGQFFNIIVGSVGCVLSMTMNEKALRNSVFIVLLVNFILNAILVPTYGAFGAALSTAVAVAFQNIFLLYMVRANLNITTTPIIRPRGVV